MFTNFFNTMKPAVLTVALIAVVFAMAACRAPHH